MIKKRLGAVVFAALLALAVAAPAQAATRAEIEAQIAMLKAQLAVLIGGTSMNFTIDMTVGSTGGEVTRLQSFLIEKGYAIPAGATGYFGEQTRSALARYQAANGIAPAVGYFGPLTRTKVNASLVVVPPPHNDDEDAQTGDREEARDAIDELDGAIDDAQDDIDDAEDDGEDVDDANDILDEARDTLDDAEEAYDDRNYDDALDLADDGMDLVDEALDEAGIDGDSDENDAEDAIDELDAAIDDAQDDIDDAEDDGKDVDDANDLLDEARDKLADAEEALDDEDYDEAVDLADEGMDLVDEALDEADVDSDTDGDAETISTSAVTTSASGADNDYATFEVKLRLNAFGDDMYIPRDADDAFTYRIENASNGSTVTGGTRSETVSSSADEEGDYFLIREDDSETFTFRVVFDPDPSDEGASFRMQLLTVGYSDDQEPPTASWSTHSDSEFRTGSTYIAD